MENKESIPFNLPEVKEEPKANITNEVVASPDIKEKAMSQAVEQGGASRQVSGSPMLSVSPLGQISAVVPSQQQAQSQQSTPLPTSMLHAADTDLIEKEWVAKAKEIVEQTKNDPYLQNKEVNKIRADYIKKRYNKEIKVDSD